MPAINSHHAFVLHPLDNLQQQYSSFVVAAHHRQNGKSFAIDSIDLLWFCVLSGLWEESLQDASDGMEILKRKLLTRGLAIDFQQNCQEQRLLQVSFDLNSLQKSISRF